MPEETRVVLEKLASQTGTTVAIVSGRACEDLRSRVGLDAILAGNHGLEIQVGNSRWRHPAAVERQPALHQLCGELSGLAAKIPGALVEDKGLTASFHYRRVDGTRVPALAEAVNAVVAPHNDCFFLRHGKKVFEILPTIRWGKGSAVLRILEQLSATQGPGIAVCYIGDDSTDECAFQKLPGAITIRVGGSQPTAARFRVAGTTQVREFLDRLSKSPFPAAPAKPGSVF